MLAKAEHPEPIYGEVALMLAGSIHRNFQEGGRPEKWKVSRRAKRQGGRTLVDTSRLQKEATTPQVDAKGITFGSTLPGAAAHQYGFDDDVTVRAHRRKVHSRDIVRGKGTSRKKVASGVAFVNTFTRRMKMPKRPYIVFLGQDIQDAKTIIAQRILV